MKTLLVFASHPELAESVRHALNPELYKIIHRLSVEDAEPFSRDPGRMWCWWTPNWPTCRASGFWRKSDDCFRSRPLLSLPVRGSPNGKRKLIFKAFRTS